MIILAIAIMSVGFVLAVIGLTKGGDKGKLPLYVGIILSVVGSILAILLT